MRTHTSLASPVGEVTLVADDNLLTGLYLDPPGRLTGVPLGRWDDGALPAARAQLAAYFTGELQVFDLPLADQGTAFQRRVWAALRAVPYGTTCTYGDLAREIGAPAAVRAVGAANGRNPIAVVVPCHRVIGANGTLTGYAGGLERKRFLLDLERGVLPLEGAPAGSGTGRVTA